jgi:hypothetical protein
MDLLNGSIEFLSGLPLPLCHDDRAGVDRKGEADAAEIGQKKNSARETGRRRLPGARAEAGDIQRTFEINRKSHRMSHIRMAHIKSHMCTEILLKTVLSMDADLQLVCALKEMAEGMRWKSLCGGQ